MCNLRYVQVEFEGIIWFALLCHLLLLLLHYQLVLLGIIVR